MSEEKKTEDTSEEVKNSEEPKEEKKETSEKEIEGKKCEDNSCKEEGCCGLAGGKNIFVWLIIAVLVIGLIAFFQMKKDGGDEAKTVSEKVSAQVTEKTESVLGDLVPPEVPVEIGDVMEESGLYSVRITVEGQEVTSYMTKDMTKFIPQLIEVNPVEEDGEEMNPEETPAANVQTKSAKPEVEVFVMSHCPYGTQMEKGFLPVMAALGNKIDAEIKFVDYAMHGEKEVTEQVRQYCIQKNEPQKFTTYLSCFLESEDAAGCDLNTGVNQALLNQCVAATDAEYQTTAMLNDKASWVSGQFPQFNVHKEDNEKYGVQGSPTLVINGEVIQAGRDSASLLAAVCSGFEEQPEECMVELSSASPSPGFGSGVDASGASADAGCGV